MEFPPNWDFILVEDLPGYTGGSEDLPLNMEVLLEMSGTTSGTFRFLMGGNSPVEAVFTASRLFGPAAEGNDTKTLPEILHSIQVCSALGNAPAGCPSLQVTNCVLTFLPPGCPHCTKFLADKVLNPFLWQVSTSGWMSGPGTSRCARTW